MIQPDHHTPRHHRPPGPHQTPHENVAHNLKRLRRERKMSAQQLSNALAEHGCDMSRQVIANFESGRLEDIGVNRVYALAAVLEVDLWSLTAEVPLCLTCSNEPPPGFRCTTCGQEQPRDLGSNT